MKRILATLLALIILLLPLAAAADEPRYEEHPMVSDGLKVYGRFYAPEGTEGPWPTVILSHGFGSTWEESKLYIPLFLEQGVACYVFDFPGGAAKNRSEGSFLEMSVMTEKRHLLNIIDEVCAMPQVGKVMLLGFSQGGVVTGLAAVERAEQIVGEVLFYPALCISDDGHAAYGEKEN
ncbi:MAG: alpha/beta hydrolase, partial [Butyrivibrio sp.]|nr:alpha/beta hydrolase [Butyrivibrio sp.]